MWRLKAGTGVRLSAQSRGRGVPRQVRGSVSPHKAADEAYRGRYAGPSLRTKPRTRRTEAGTRVRLSAQSRGRGVPRQVRGSVSPHKAADEAYRGRYAGPSLRTKPRTRRTEAGTGGRLSAQGRGRGVPRQVRGSVSPHKAADEAYRGRYGVRLSAQGRGRGVPRQVRGSVSPHKAADEAYRGRYGVRLSAQGRGRGVPRQVRGASFRTRPRTRRTEAGTGCVFPHKAADEAYRGRYGVRLSAQ